MGVGNSAGVISQEGWSLRIQGRFVWKSQAHHSDEGHLSWCVALLDHRIKYAAKLEVILSATIKKCCIVRIVTKFLFSLKKTTWKEETKEGSEEGRRERDRT